MKKLNAKKINKIISSLEEHRETLDGVLNDEQETFDARSEKWQESEKGEHASNMLSEIDASITSIDQLIEELSNSLDEY